MSIRYALWSLFAPSQLILCAVLIGSVSWALGARRVGRWLALGGALGLLLCGLLPSASYLALRLESRYPRPALPARVDGIVQLAGAERVTASAHFAAPELRRSAGRYFTTLELARLYPLARVVHTGNGADRPAAGVVGGETAIARRLYASAGLDAARLTFEDRSTDTCESARRTRQLLRPRADETWLLVTSALHLPRAMACFRAAGWNVVPYAADHQAVPGGLDAGSFRMAENLVLFDDAAHEWLGLAYYRMTGRTQPAR